MSTIVKQPACAPQAKSAADLLAGATKKGKSNNHLVYVGEVGCEAAARWLDLNDKLAETERELNLARDRVLPAWDAFFIFDLPDCSLAYDGRRSELAEICNVGIGSASPQVGSAPTLAFNTSL